MICGLNGAKFAELGMWIMMLRLRLEVSIAENVIYPRYDWL